MHPSGSRSFGKIPPAGKKEQGSGDLGDLSRDFPCSFEPETPVP